MLNSIETIADVENFASEIALDTVDSERYSPMEKQIFFFTSVKLVKEKVTLESRESLLPKPKYADIRTYMKSVKSNLDKWGDVVAALQERNELEWELLRLQMEKAVNSIAARYACSQRITLKQEALARSLLKVLEITEKMPRARVINSEADVVAFVVRIQDKLTSIYDFKNSFYAYASVIAQNELISLLRTEGREVSIDNIVIATAPSPSLETVEDEIDAENEERAAQAAFCEKLGQLTELLREHLTHIQYRVIMYTLSARSQFWRAVSITGFVPPEAVPSAGTCTDDADIARCLNTNPNNIRVHRNNSKQKIDEVDPELTHLLGLLLAK